MAQFYSSSVYADPVKNIRYYQISDERIIIYYDLECIKPIFISVEVSLDDSNGFTIKPGGLSGDIGKDVNAGTHKRIIWDIHKDIERLPEDFNIKVSANHLLQPVPLTEKDTKNITAIHINSPIKRDGLLNEPSWSHAKPATDFTQRELVEGAPATEKTQVRILYDRDNMYIGVTCFDSEPDKIINNELRRDGELSNDDNFIVVLDTFNDRRSGFFFQVNPNGARVDAKVTENLDHVHDDWNGIWDVSATISDFGWSAEIVIPFMTLRFSNAETQNWGINFSREIARKKEETLWCAWKRNDGILQLSKSGRLVGLEYISRGKKIEFKPYSLGGLEREVGDTNRNLKYGLDLKYPIASNLTLDFTTLTDFAQVEADRTRINLTRFDLYYPEKRDFFLEGAEIFGFGSRFTSPFYSRKIGVTPDDEMEQVPIIAGAKVTGRAGSYNLGILNMQTDQKDEFPSTNYSVVRIQKNILEKSYIGFIATNLYDANDHQNQAFGIDFSYNTSRFLTNRNLEIEGYIAENRTPGINHGTRAGRIQLRYPNDILDVHLLHYVVGENYDPEIGFVQRKGIKQYSVDFDYTPRPAIPYIQQLWFSPLDINYYTDMHNKLLTRQVRIIPFGFNTTTDEEFRISIEQSYEYLDEDFNILNDVVIPPGTYSWWQYGTEFESNPSRPVSVETRVQWGNFYSGKRNAVEVGGNFKVNKHFSFSTDLEHNSITIGSQRFDTKEYSGRVNVNISTRLTSRTFIQWNNESKEVNLNFRIHYIPQIGSDIYFVYNHLWGGEQNYKTTYNAGMGKVAYLIRF